MAAPKPPFVGDVDPAAFDFFGVDPTLITDFIVGTVPQTRTRTSHGLTLRTAGGKLIGAIQSVQHTQTRTIDEEWQVAGNSYGQAPADLVPQSVGTRTLRVQRLDLFTRTMEEVFGTREIVVLTDQLRPFTLRETWQSPVGIVAGGRRVYEYTGCWLRNVGRTASATDDRLVKVDAEIVYALRRRVL